MAPLFSAIPIVLVTALVQAAKEFGLPSKYAQITAFSLAIVFACMFLWNSSITESFVGILQYALGAIGLWELGKPMYENLKEKPKDIRDPVTKDGN